MRIDIISMVRPIRLVITAWAALSVIGCTRSDGRLERHPTQPRIVFLGVSPPDRDGSYQAFLEAWSKSGAEKCAEAQVLHQQATDDSMPALRAAAAAAAIQLPTVLVAPTADSARAAREATELPLVFASYLNPVRGQIVSSEGPRPENATGVALDDRLLTKRLEILREAFPRAKTVGILADQAWRTDSEVDRHLAAEHDRTGFEFLVVDAQTADEVLPAMTSDAARQVNVWYIPATYVGYLAEGRIINHLKQLKKPAIHATTGEVEAGALMAYSQDTSFTFDAMASLVNRVCNGEKPGDIPIERPRRFVLSVRASYDLGPVHIAPSIVARADRIE
jgi:putative tryptophan/tyrosine transport system substrate-binding protein